MFVKKTNKKSPLMLQKAFDKIQQTVPDTIFQTLSFCKVFFLLFLVNHEHLSFLLLDKNI